MGILDSLKYLDKSRGGRDVSGGYDAPMHRPEPPSVLDSISTANDLSSAPQWSYGLTSEARRSPELGYLKLPTSQFPGFEARPQPTQMSEFMAPSTYMPQPVQYLEPRPHQISTHTQPEEHGAIAQESFQPMGLSQEELRAIYEGRAQPPARVVPGQSFVEYARPHGMMSEPAVPQFTISQVPRDMGFPVRTEQVPFGMPHMAMPQGAVLSTTHDSYLHDGGQAMYSSKRYTLADRAKWGDTQAGMWLNASVIPDAPPQVEKVERKVDREGEMIRSLFPLYQPGMMPGDFLRAPLIPHSETSVEEARPLFGPLPVSDKEFIVGKMDFNSMPTWTDSLVQYLKEDPTYFATRVDPEEFTTQARHDLTQVKVNDPSLETATRQSPQAAPAPAQTPTDSARRSSAGAGSSPKASGSYQPAPTPNQAATPGGAKPPATSPMHAQQNNQQPAPAPAAPSPQAPPPAAPKAPQQKAPQDGSALPGAQPSKPPPPKKKTGGIADRLAAFQKAVEDSGTNN